MRLIDWQSQDPTPGQQIRFLLADAARATWFHVLWARKALVRGTRLLCEDIHAWFHIAAGLPDPRELVSYRIAPEALPFAEEVTRQ